MKVVVLMPTYNEVEILERNIRSVFAVEPNLDLVIIDDSSPDGTGQLADRMAASDGRITVIHRSQKEGLGKAYAAGFKHALARGYSRILQMDADGSHQPKDLGKLLAGTGDLVIGSRWVPGGEVLNWPTHRLWISRVGNSYARFAIGCQVRDVTAGFRNYSSELLAKIPIEQIEARGYGFQVEMTKHSLELGAKITEVPISFLERTGGRSKMTYGIIFEAFAFCTKWLWQRLTRR